MKKKKTRISKDDYYNIDHSGNCFYVTVCIIVISALYP